MTNPFGDMERHNKVPRGFLVLVAGLIAWGICYIAAYTPEISGWSQRQAFTRELEADKAKAVAAAAKTAVDRWPKPKEEKK